jgi:hypothetical protein
MSTKAKATKSTATAIIPCDDRCMFAKGDDCDCECGGKNHKQGFRLPAHQREILRTKAGRRVKYLTPGTGEFRFAESLWAKREEGWTKKDIAQWFEVSAPTVRRYLTRYVLTMAALGTPVEEDIEAA